MRGSRRYLAALRRGVALGLALVAAWGVSLMVDLPTPEETAAQAAALLSGQGTDAPPAEKALTGWRRLLLSQSGLLAAGEEVVLRLRSGELEPSGGAEPEEPDDQDDQEAPDLQPPAGEDDILETTAQGKEGGSYFFQDGVYLYNRSSLTLDGSVLSEGSVEVTLGEGPQILILHTHGSEAYAQSDGDLYQESDPYRTTDCTHNVVKVGAEMATVFRAYGFQVIHDTTLYDYPAYNGAYDRSRAAVEQWLEQYPTIQVVLDVHRDALVGSDGQVYKLVSEEAGKKVAQVMLVVGSSGSGAEHPRWRDNLAFAAELQRGVVRGYTSLARPIVLRDSRYNQQLLPGSLLVEVGGHGNTLTEAVDGARLWADNVARTLLSRKE